MALVLCTWHTRRMIWVIILNSMPLEIRGVLVFKLGIKYGYEFSIFYSIILFPQRADKPFLAKDSWLILINGYQWNSVTSTTVRII